MIQASNLDGHVVPGLWYLEEVYCISALNKYGTRNSLPSPFGNLIKERVTRKTNTLVLEVLVKKGNTEKWEKLIDLIMKKDN